jgi:hypothetical protein
MDLGRRGVFFSFPSVWTVIRIRNRPVLTGSSFWREPPVPVFTFDTLIFRVIIIIIIKFLRWWDCRINDQVCYGSKCCVISIFWYLEFHTICVCVCVCVCEWEREFILFYFIFNSEITSIWRFLKFCVITSSRCFDFKTCGCNNYGVFTFANLELLTS